MANEEEPSALSPRRNVYEGAIGALLGIAEQCDLPNLSIDAKRRFSLRFVALAIQTAVPESVRRDLAQTCRYMYTLDEGSGRKRKGPQPIIQENPELLIGEPLDIKLEQLIRSVTKKSPAESDIRTQFRAAKKSLVNLKLRDDMRSTGFDRPGPVISER